MRVVCIHIPRRGPSDVSAVFETVWDVVVARTFMHQIDDLVESIWEPFSLELYAANKMVYVCMAGSDDMIDILTNGVYSWMGDCEIRDVEDYTQRIGTSTMLVGTEMRLWRPDIYPLKDYKSLPTDSMVPIVTPLSQIHEQDRMLYQIVVRPLKDTARLHLHLALKRGQENFVRHLRAQSWLKKGLPVNSLKLIQDKCTGNLLSVSFRIASLTDLPSTASKHERNETYKRLCDNVGTIADAMKTFNTSDENRFVTSKLESGKGFISRLQERRFLKPFMLSSIELTSIFHPPLLGSLPNTAMVLSRKGPPPRHLPTSISDPDICTFGTVNYRDLSTKFGIKRFDRRRHLYIVGKSGSGKSCLMQLLVRNDMERGLGCAVIDPHGDLIDDIMKLVPKHRVKDVVVFDPSDVNFPASFNPMDPVRPELRVRVALSFLDAFKRVFGGDWSQKMDHVLRYAMLGLLAVPGSNILSLRRMLSDEQFRGEVVRRASDESVKRFWLRDFMNRRQEFEEGPMSRLLNRLDELLASENIRNILGQSNNAFNFRSFMDSGKIVLIKISKGVLGSENATLLGTLLIWKIYEAAMSRADIPAEDRKDFFLYVDEFQNFATESFTEIVSESRKYNLSLTFANQYLGQLSPTIRKTVFGNVANILSFRVGADDAGIVAQEFKPLFGDEDLLNLPLREFYLKMSIEGQVQDSFSGRTIDLKHPSDKENYAEECLAHSRKTYCRTLEQVTSLPHKKRLTPAGPRQTGNS
jgi:hypothetical protein